MAVGWVFGRSVGTILPEAGFGVCPGYADPEPGRPVALTNWLTSYLNRLAGLPEDGPPLTFGDLWGNRDPEAEHAINLQMMTTNLTHGRPYRLPDLGRVFSFDPDEWRRYFPEAVVRWMIDHPRPRSDDSGHDGPAQGRRLLPMPDAADLPVVVAARLSLSFPLLIGALPLYAIDYGRVPYLRRMGKEPFPERCWFSDGGICSNFPVHLFDSYLPRWPTFGINLKAFDPDDTAHEYGVWMPDQNKAGVKAMWNRFDAGGGLKSVVGFLGAIVNAARDWGDNTLLPLPGYRDRIVHISLDEETEGGTNLDMAAPIIQALAGAGPRRGDARPALRPPRITDVLTWDNHRWIRFRSLMALFEDMIEELDTALEHPVSGDRTYADLVARGPTTPQGLPPAPARAAGFRQIAARTAQPPHRRMARCRNPPTTSSARGRSPSPGRRFGSGRTSDGATPHLAIVGFAERIGVDSR